MKFMLGKRTKSFIMWKNRTSTVDTQT